MQSLTIGVVGAGLIGGTLALNLAALGHQVRIANSKAPSTLTQFEGITGLTPEWATDAVHGVDIAIITIPENRMEGLCAQLKSALPDDVVVIDTSNYYPNRDGRIAVLDEGTPDSAWVSELLGRPVYKAFNNIIAPSLKHKGTDDKGRRVGLSVAGPDGEGKRMVFGLIDQLGFEPVDGGTLAESWRQQPGTPSYCQDFAPADLRDSLAETTLDDIDEFHRKRDRIVDFDAAAAQVAQMM